MTKAIPTTNLDTQTQQLIKQTGQGKLRVVFEEDGKPVAAVMPMSAQEWEADRKRFFATIRQMQQTANLSEKEADNLALEAVKKVRALRRGGGIYSPIVSVPLNIGTT